LSPCDPAASDPDACDAGSWLARRFRLAAGRCAGQRFRKIAYDNEAHVGVDESTQKRPSRFSLGQLDLLRQIRTPPRRPQHLRGEAHATTELSRLGVE
jgi:hypothetical protein